MVEEDDPVGAGDVLEQEGFELRVVVGRNGGVRNELLLGRGWQASDEGEGVAVEVVVIGLGAADVVNLDGVGGRVVIADGQTGWRRVDVVEGGTAV